MSSIVVSRVSKAFGQVIALDRVDLALESGSVTALLGPSGCGKTTLLRVIAGFERPDSGSVELGGRTMTGVRPEHRAIGYMSQEGALFPHLTVAGNIGFGLTRAARRAGDRVRELLELVDLPASVGDRYPHQLSGGQQQRVALARALARRPSVVLLDEPFAALDTGLRAQTRNLMGQALRDQGVTTVLVTHDQQEALSFADEVVLLRAGQVRQTGSPHDLYEAPVDLWAAAFLGDLVTLEAVAADGVADCALGPVSLADKASGQVTVLIRPEQIVLGQGGCPATVRALEFHGHDSLVTCELAGGSTAMARIPGRPRLQVGDRTGLQVIGVVRAYHR